MVRGKMVTRWDSLVYGRPPGHHEIPHYYLANHLSSYPLDFNSNHMLWTLWILDLFLSIKTKSCVCVCVDPLQQQQFCWRELFWPLSDCLPALGETSFAINLTDSVGTVVKQAHYESKPLQRALTVTQHFDLGLLYGLLSAI